VKIDGQGVAWIAGTKVKVTAILSDKLAHDWSPEEIHFQHPHWYWSLAPEASVPLLRRSLIEWLRARVS
jgi:hypothetical protein